MGNYCCKEKRKKKLTLLLLGLDNAGKTRAANGLIGERVNSPIPTVGFSVLNLKYANYAVKIFDLGGGPNIRDIWQEYFVNAHGVIFVIDSSDISRFVEVKMVLEGILRSDKIAGKPILILANKQDQENAVDEIEIIEYLNLEYLVNTRKCPTLVQSCSASENKVDKLDTGVQKGYNWLMGYIDKHYETLNQRVEIDVREQELKEKQELLEKIQNIRSLHALEENKTDEDTIQTYSDYMKTLNGQAKVLKEEPSTSMIDYEEANTSSTNDETSDSSGSAAPVYISNTYAPTERPKSAVELVKRQLQLSNGTQKTKVRTRSNKTAPINLYGTRMPRSADERRKETLFDRRNLKSADNVLFTISGRVTDDIKVVDSSGDHNMINLNNYGCKLPPLRDSEVPWVHKPNRQGDGLSIVDIL
ncbi:ADP-ribosylation factor-like protein 13B isoform X1 [Diorhabda carinulata]|uniref:ADP-ribosylation factor-like protein 13B isoform X1 n=1 Tax=Diorhabda carinulata TaxID=1163345 RepID=UPI0025A20F59|nr:ADP-ribosylation factor-like protein 13B isoform X1 [Diorhabda carinulata]